MSEVFLLEVEDGQDNWEELGKKVAEKVKRKFDAGDSVAVKLHFGERKSDTHLKPEFVRPIYESLDTEEKCLVDCTVLYKGDRSFADTHIQVAEDNGFGFGDIVIADGQEGDQESEIEIEGGEHFEKVKIGEKLEEYDSLLAISHMTGHGANGLGAALKNVGMGLGSKGGKLEMHSAFKLKVDRNSCTGCMTCIRNCPEDAIELVDGKAEIDHERCIGCGKCISVCPENAVRIPWGASSSRELQERIAEYTKGAVKGKKTFYVTVMMDMTRECDCINTRQEKCLEDIGILVSEDPVAIDQAAIDLIGEDAYGNGIDYEAQVRHAEKIGLGSREYQLREI